MVEYSAALHTSASVSKISSSKLLSPPNRENPNIGKYKYITSFVKPSVGEETMDVYDAEEVSFDEISLKADDDGTKILNPLVVKITEGAGFPLKLMDGKHLRDA